MLAAIRRTVRRRTVRRSGDPESGASAVEYGLVLAAIAGVIVAVVFALATVVKNDYSATSTCIDTQGTSAGC